MKKNKARINDDLHKSKQETIARIAGERRGEVDPHHDVAVAVYLNHLERTKPDPADNHGNSHDRSMLPGAKIVDLYGGAGVTGEIQDPYQDAIVEVGTVENYFGTKGIVHKTLSDDSMPITLDGEQKPVVIPKGLLDAVAGIAEDMLTELITGFGNTMVVQMSHNRYAPLNDVIDYVNNNISGAPADYVERAIGEQYGIIVLNKAKSMRASK